MPAENCDERKCPMNKPNGQFRKCGIDIMSVVDGGKCEFWEAYKESQKLKWAEEEKNV